MEQASTGSSCVIKRVYGVTCREEFLVPQCRGRAGEGGGRSSRGWGWGVSMSRNVDVEWNGPPLGQSEC